MSAWTYCHEQEPSRPGTYLVAVENGYARTAHEIMADAEAHGALCVEEWWWNGGWFIRGTRHFERRRTVYAWMVPEKIQPPPLTRQAAEALALGRVR